jgi:hypothetical protein
MKRVGITVALLLVAGCSRYAHVDDLEFGATTEEVRLIVGKMEFRERMGGGEVYETTLRAGERRGGPPMPWFLWFNPHGGLQATAGQIDTIPLIIRKLNEPKN